MSVRLNPVLPVFRDCVIPGELGLASAFQNFLVGVERDFFGFAIQNEVVSLGGITGNAHLSEPHHAISKIGEDRNKHSEIFVNVTLRDFRLDFEFAAFRWLKFILKTVAWHLGTPDPLSKKPIQAPILLKAHLQRLAKAKEGDYVLDTDKVSV